MFVQVQIQETTFFDFVFLGKSGFPKKSFITSSTDASLKALI